MSYFPTTTFAPNQFSLDAGQRLRVSEMITLGDYKELGYPHTLFYDVAGTGTWSASGSDDNKFRLHVEPGQYLIRQTKLWHSYYSGKSQFIEMTFDTFGLQSGVRKLLGYYSSGTTPPYDTNYDGFWLLSNGVTNEYRLVIRRSGTLTYSVPMSAWIGYEAVKNYDWNNFTVIAFDFLWLGGATFRMWIKTSRGFELLHEIVHAGTQPDVFIHAPTQPLRYEIKSTDGTGDLRMICSTVATEGATNNLGIIRSVYTPFTGITLPVVGTEYPVLAVRGASASNLLEVQLLTQDVWASVQSTADQILWTVQINPALSGLGGDLNFTQLDNSAIEYAINDVGAEVVTQGTVIASGVLSYGQLLPTQSLYDNALSWHGIKIDGTRDIYVITATPLLNPTTVAAGMNVKEF